jgi:hypothetical protein
MSKPREMIAQAEQMEQKAIELSFGRDKITEAMMELTQALYKADELTQGIEGVQEQLHIIFAQAKSLGEEGFKRDDVLQCLSDLAKVASVGQEEMQRQRDAILEEAATVIERLKSGDFFDQKFELGAEVYEAAVEQHNQAFWESLPYDMASMLGGKWGNSQADLLYALLTDEAEEVADGWNLEVEDVTSFRAELFEMVNKLYEKGE